MKTTKPLEGVNVIELGHTVAAPYAGMILAQLGANVIKIENPPTGDYTRGMPPFRTDGVSSAYQALNRGKKSVLLNLKDPKDSQSLRHLLKSKADVLIHNLKFGAMEELGFDSEALLLENPSLIYCNVGAYGHTGPKKGLPGYDPLMQAYSGLMSIMGEEGRPPIRVGVSITDQAAGRPSCRHVGRDRHSSCAQRKREIWPRMPRRHVFVRNRVGLDERPICLL